MIADRKTLELVFFEKIPLFAQIRITFKRFFHIEMIPTTAKFQPIKLPGLSLLGQDLKRQINPLTCA
jgi:hypothetical protein